ncbi:MAG: FtsW/RodA/SpoVE family cell cycle protein [Oscillospiraceae bacterium]|nr:FtsW/RodA/SpoVE family cell cycle protein [Oscillospiraceae bacterium]
MDVPFCMLTLLILLVGLVMLLSASYIRSYYETYGSSRGPDATYYFRRQLIFSVLGVAAMLFISRIRLSFIRKLSFPAIIGSFLLLLAVLMKGLSTNGAVRWLELPGNVTFQPSEIAKTAVVIAFADWMCKLSDKMKTFKYGVLPFLIALLCIAVPLLLQPHLSATIIILLLGFMMMFAGGTRLRYLGAAVLAAVLGYALLMYLIKIESPIIEKVSFFRYAVERITAWKDPESVLLSGGWQIIQSLYAIGSGGLLGLGLGQSRQKYLYLPFEHNDYIFSIVCEELGFVGGVLILLLFALLIIRGFWLAMHCRDKFSSLVVTGMMILLSLQVFLNVAVGTNLLPATGISLPFFSYGGTALDIQLAEMGIVLSASRDIADK